MAKEKLLLHCCCAPCSSAIIEYLYKYYDITLYFYNPNITNEDEYVTRAEELIRLIDSMNLDIKVFIEFFNNKPFYELAEGMEKCHEGGSRCMGCYAHRLNITAQYAIENGFTQFSTTLTISPYKDSAIVNRTGTMVASQYGNLMYMPFDFGFLYTRSLELCEKYNLYQQNYCGCEYSKGGNV